MSNYLSRNPDDFSSQNGMGPEYFMGVSPGASFAEHENATPPTEAELQPTGYWMRYASRVPLGAIVELDPFKPAEQNPFRELPDLRGQGDYNIDSM